MAGARVVVASRKVEGGDVGRGLSAIRKAGSSLANSLAKRILKVDLSDPMSGFFMVRRESIDDLAPKLSNQGFKVLLEGHCDERGTVDYNLALGERRAQSVYQYLVNYGIPASRLSTVSFGKERPFASGSTEYAFSQNRRVHLRVMPE